jgi:hypothetical protein
VERTAFDGDFPRERALFHWVWGQSRKPAGRSASVEIASDLLREGAPTAPTADPANRKPAA